MNYKNRQFNLIMITPLPDYGGDAIVKGLQSCHFDVQNGK